MSKKDLYLNSEHISSTTTLSVKTYSINGIPVCMSWYGCDKHKREACQFLLSRQFGTILVCGLTGNDLDQEMDKINTVPEDCPLQRGERMSL